MKISLIGQPGVAAFASFDADYLSVWENSDFIQQNEGKTYSNPDTVLNDRDGGLLAAFFAHWDEDQPAIIM